MLLKYLGYINYKKATPDGKVRLGQIIKVTEEEGKHLLARDPNGWEIVSDEPKPKVEQEVVKQDVNEIKSTKESIKDVNDEAKEQHIPKRGRPKKSSRLSF